MEKISKNNPDLMEKIVNLAKRRGFVYPSSEIYGGLANTWDFGPLGVELKNNIKSLWWKYFVQDREDMVGLDSAIILNPKIWEASGHVEGFTELLTECKKCKNRFRVDYIIEEQIGKEVEGLPLDKIEKILTKEKIQCPSCKAIEFTSPRKFNNLFKTYIGSTEDDASLAYLRGETAQGIFVDFKQILDSTRKRIPFGIGQIGKSFRNEITTGNFIFRVREFEIAELEYFISPKENWQKIFNEWLKYIYGFSAKLGIEKSHLHEHDLPNGKRAHYSKKTVDLYFDFPFGEKELWAVAYRTDYDLSRHQKYSGKDMSYSDPETGGKYIPHVIEPTFGVERTFLAVLVSAYEEEKVRGETRVVLKLPKAIVPIQVAVLPLSKDKKLSPLAKKIYDALKTEFVCEYDETQSIGRRYRRQDEIGTPICVTVDFDSLVDNCVTVRDRDTMKQDRIKVSKLVDYTNNYFRN